MKRTVTEAIEYRRSVRIFKKESIDPNKVKKCIINASLAPNSSNLQTWEFYHIINKTVLNSIAKKACFNQNAARTANQMVVFVVRKDLWRKRAKANIDFLNSVFDKKMGKNTEKNRKMALKYYKVAIPIMYTSFFGILGLLRYIFFQTVGIFRPIFREVRLSDLRIVSHKSTALAAQNFMLSMAEIGYDTCPMEGSDTSRIKKILNLPSSTEINMVIGCGIRDEKGIYSERYRIPFEEVYKEIK
jgi:nitroreductase